MAPCSICDHPQRHAIEAALHAGQAQQAIVARFTLSSRKVLRTHLQHVTVLPPSGAPPQPADPPGPALPTVAQAQNAYTRLQQQVRDAEATVPRLATALEDAAVALRVARVHDRPDRFARQDALDRAQHDLDAAQQEVRDLTQQVQDAERALEGAKTRQREAAQAHWQQVFGQLTDEWEQYCVQYLLHPGTYVSPPRSALDRPGGPRVLGDRRRSTIVALKERFPVQEEGAEHAVSGVL